MTYPEYLALHRCGPLVQSYLAARLERHQAERDFMATWTSPDPAVLLTPVEAASGAYMEAAWRAECDAYLAALAERPGLPVGP